MSRPNDPEYNKKDKALNHALGWEPEEIRKDREAVQKAHNSSGSFGKRWKSANSDKRFEELTDQAHKMAQKKHDMTLHGEGKEFGKYK